MWEASGDIAALCHFAEKIGLKRAYRSDAQQAEAGAETGRRPDPVQRLAPTAAVAETDAGMMLPPIKVMLRCNCGRVWASRGPHKGTWWKPPWHWKPKPGTVAETRVCDRCGRKRK
jgi:hypothetical protein